MSLIQCFARLVLYVPCPFKPEDQEVVLVETCPRAHWLEPNQPTPSHTSLGGPRYPCPPLSLTGGRRLHLRAPLSLPLPREDEELHEVVADLRLQTRLLRPLLEQVIAVGRAEEVSKSPLPLPEIRGTRKIDGNGATPQWLTAKNLTGASGFRLGFLPSHGNNGF